MTITTTELKRNLTKYLLEAKNDDIYITKFGKVIAKLSNPNNDKVSSVNSLSGIPFD